MRYSSFGQLAVSMFVTGNRQRLGAVGEGIAADYLATLGWHVCARNWRTRYGELDLIARLSAT